MSDCLKVWNVEAFLAGRKELHDFMYDCWRKGFKMNKIVEEAGHKFGQRYTEDELKVAFREMWDKAFDQDLQALDGTYEG